MSEERLEDSKGTGHMDIWAEEQWAPMPWGYSTARVSKASSWCQGDWMGKEQQRRRVRGLITLVPCILEINHSCPWRRERLSTPVFWPGECHGLYSPWGHKESDTTETFTHSLLQTTSEPCAICYFSVSPTWRHHKLWPRAGAQQHRRQLSVTLTPKSFQRAFLHLW